VASSREALLAKLQALKARTRSSNVHEAATAAAIFEKLIQAHHVQEDELEAARADVDGPRSRHTTAEVAPFLCSWPEAQSESFAWLEHLAHFLAGQYGAASITDYDPFTGREGVTVVGGPDAVAITRFMFATLSVEIVRLCEEEASRRKRRATDRWKLDFCAGALRGIESAMKKARREIRKHATSTALAIAVDRQRDATRALEKRFGEDNIEDTTSQVDATIGAAFDKGKRAGSRLGKGRARALPDEQPAIGLLGKGGKA
jgi:hypothetical protein